MSNPAFVFNTKDEYTAKQLSERYRDHLPMLVAVSKGFYGNREEMTFSTGQILRLHELRQQQRALVHDDKQKTLSVPLDYKHLFFVGVDRTQSFTLRQIAEKYSLPAQVHFADPHVHFDSDNDHSRNLHSLTIIKVHNESYFLANTIANGEPLPEVIPIPLYLKQVTFCPVIGVREEGVSGGGQTLMDRVLRPQSMARVNFNQDHSDKEMVQLSDRPLKATDNIYANIDTNIYINARTRGGGARRLPPPPPPPPPAEEPLHDQPSVSGAASVESEYQNYNTVGRKGMKSPEASSPSLPPRPGNLAPLSRGPASPGVSKGSRGEAGDSRSESSSPQEYQDVYEPVAHSDSESGSDVYEPVGELQWNKPKPEKKSTKKTKSRPSGSKPSPDPAIPFTSELQQKLKIRKHDSKSSEKPTPVKDPPKTTFNTADNSEPKANTLPFKVKLRPVNARNAPQPSTPPKEETPPLKPSQLAKKVDIAFSSAANDEPKEGPKPASTQKPAPPTKPLKPAATKPSGEKTSLPRTTGAKPSPKSESQPLVTPSKPVGTAPTKLQGTTTKPQRSTTSATKPQSLVTPDAKPHSLGTSATKPQTSQHSATKPQNSAISQTPNPADYTNQKEMAIVGPTVQKTPPSSDEVKQPPSKQPSTPQPKLQKQGSESREELKPLAEMSIPDVQALLSRLNLEDYREKFERKQIDGVLLSMLSEEALKEDFNMSSIDRIKLMAFVQKGHLPRYEDWPLQ